MGSSHKKEEKDIIAPLLILGGVVAFSYVFLGGSFSNKNNSGTAELSSISSTQEPSNIQSQKIVNEHLLETQSKMDLQRGMRVLENKQFAPSVSNGAPSVDAKLNPGYGVEFNNTTPESQVGQIIRKPKGAPDYNSPDQYIQNLQKQLDARSNYDEAYKEAYVQQFIENARKGGYEVRVNDNYEVISVRPIRHPDSQRNIFDLKGGGAK